MPAPGEWPSFCVEEAGHLSRSASPSTAYYLKARQAVPPEQRPSPKKRGPVVAASDEDLVGHIRRVLAESPFHGEGYRKVWARLRHQGIRTASERVRRLMREHHLQALRKGGNAHVGPAMLAGERGRALASKMPGDRILSESDGPFARVNDLALHPWEVGTAIESLGDIWGVASDKASAIIKGNLARLTPDR